MGRGRRKRWGFLEVDALGLGVTPTHSAKLAEWMGHPAMRVKGLSGTPQAPQNMLQPSTLFRGF